MGRMVSSLAIGGIASGLVAGCPARFPVYALVWVPAAAA